MTSLAGSDLVPWGADLVEARKEGGDVARVAEEKLLARYRKLVRAELQGASRKTVAESFPATGAVAALLDRMRGSAEPGSEDLLEEAIVEILQELDHLRAQSPSDYLVDDRTGKLVAPLSQESVFRPPSFIGEDGIERQASLTVHPGITSSLALAAQEEARARELARRASDPMTALALAHLLRPGAIADGAASRLISLGLTEDPLLEGEPAIFEFGRESLIGERQSLNPMFHRASMHSVTLSSRIASACPRGSFRIMNVKRKEDGKCFWFRAEVVIKPP